MDDTQRVLAEHQAALQHTVGRLLEHHALIVASNRGPVEFTRSESGEFTATRGAGGLVTAMSAVTRYAKLCWIAAANSAGDRARVAEAGDAPIVFNGTAEFDLRFVTPTPDDYRQYYNVIANPLLWFLQHNMWDSPRTPNITPDVWEAWQAYERVNQQFADAIIAQSRDQHPLVLLQDYHLYLVPRMLRQALGQRALLSLFVHIPWPGPDYWGLLPTAMRDAILRSCCTLDVMGFHTRRYCNNFLNTCQTYLPDAAIGYLDYTIRLDGHTTHIRPYPISIDVGSLQEQADTSPVVRDHRYRLRGRLGDQTIMRIDRAEPSKNIVRGFHAFELLLKEHPEHRGRVKFLAFLVPSRLGVEEYQRYLEEIMITVGWINTRYGTSDWQPVELLVGDDYERAIAAMQLYDVLLVNAITDGMNLVAKEGPTVNTVGGVLILSEGTGASEQLRSAALTVTASDIVGTAEALHTALTMPLGERFRRANHLKQMITENDIVMWLLQQFHDIEELLQPT